MPDNTFVIFLAEKDRYDYVYVDEDNMVHLLCPLIGGDTIGIDNTCKATLEMRRFFGVAGAEAGKSALQVLLEYKQDLESDISTNITPDALKHKQERLAQIKIYIAQLEKFIPKERANLFSLYYNRLGHFSASFTQSLAEKSNCVSIQLSPKDPDTFYNLQAGYVFTGPKSLGSSLRQLFSQDFRVPTKSPREMIIDAVVRQVGSEEQGVNNDFVNRVRDLLQEELKKITDEPLDLSKAPNGEDLYTYFKTTLAWEDDDMMLPREVTEGILNACLQDVFWDNLPASLFTKAMAEPKDTRVEKLSILTQFFLAEVNAFCYVYGKTKINFGTVLCTDNLKQKLNIVLREALESGLSVEDRLIAFINQHKLSSPISSEEATAIIKRFNTDYRIVQYSPHMDEFLLFFPEVKGSFANHHNRISFHFAEFVARYRQQSDMFYVNHYSKLKARQEKHLPPQNDVVKQETTAIIRASVATNPNTVVSCRYNSKERKLPLLIWAIAFNHLDIIQILVDNKDTNLNAMDDEGDTAFIWAARNGHTAIVEALLAKSADVNVKNNYGDTALMWAAQEGHTEIVRLLLAYEANVDTQQTISGNTALIRAVRRGKIEVVALLKEYQKNKLLWLAKYGRDIDTFETFYAKVDDYDKYQIMTFLATTAEKIPPNILYYLIGFYFKKENKSALIAGRKAKLRPWLWTLLLPPVGLVFALYYMFSDHRKVVDQYITQIKKKYNIDTKDQFGNTALIIATRDGDVAAVKLLLEAGADVNVKNNYGDTALILAAQEGHTEIVGLQLEYRVNVNTQNDKGRTALMCAADKGHTEIVRFLLAYEANVDTQQTISGSTALMLAAKNGHMDIVNLLLEAGANVNLQDSDKKTALTLDNEQNFTPITEILQKYQQNKLLWAIDYYKDKDIAAFQAFYAKLNMGEEDTCKKFYTDFYNPELMKTMDPRIAEYLKEHDKRDVIPLDDNLPTWVKQDHEPRRLGMSKGG